LAATPRLLFDIAGRSLLEQLVEQHHARAHHCDHQPRDKPTRRRVFPAADAAILCEEAQEIVRQKNVSEHRLSSITKSEIIAARRADTWSSPSAVRGSDCATTRSRRFP